MIVYRDRTFCPFHESCKSGKDCSIALNDDVKRGAEKIGLPISKYTEKPKCHEEVR
jgi:hypothetical protein